MLINAKEQAYATTYPAAMEEDGLCRLERKTLDLSPSMGMLV